MIRLALLLTTLTLAACTTSPPEKERIVQLEATVSELRDKLMVSSSLATDARNEARGLNALLRAVDTDTLCEQDNVVCDNRRLVMTATDNGGRKFTIVVINRSSSENKSFFVTGVNYVGNIAD